MDYFYNSSNDTGYGFLLADNAITSTRSIHIQNVSVAPAHPSLLLQQVP